MRLVVDAVKIEFRKMRSSDYDRVAEIYGEGLETGYATFETQIPDWSIWDKKHLSFGRIVALSDQELVAWAALSSVSSREVYAGVAEFSIYVAKDQRGQGIAGLLLNELIRESENNQIWTLQSSVFRNNKASIAMHLKAGFRQIGYRERIAKRDGIWYDNLLFERRSASVGN